jgi:cyclic pyranopterin phosphate synthase
VYDRYNRLINYLRISVTDRCNLRCVYCMPEDGIPLYSHQNILSFEEIADFTEVSVNNGVTKVRITGGEPLVRKHIVRLVGMLAKIKGIEDLSLTTNGILLSDYAGALKRAGLHRVNISLDSINPERFKTITRGGDVNRVLAGIASAIKEKLFPVKINCVIKESKEEEDARDVTKFCLENNLEIRYIRQMDLVRGHFFPVEGGEGGNCESCNRLRLTSNGKLKPCLFSDIEFDIRELGYQEAIRKAVEMKPECGLINKTGNFYNIGG